MDKLIFGTLAILTVASLQVIAWKLGKDGKVFALTSTVIGLIVGATFN